ncbi:hypothetical protein CICLE_v10030742mg [Citrus x clementina]|uniref:Receptor-like serine/threonine-protein kinase n=1 Tax=Citrus clementina TaxID=85681 RepID=V4VI42_CITCL|nr:G-type lectin S-receptor-like serine/threonine-protein kinase LECRK3 [Citrus x clementina]ESR52279.1 hypothetical protein CICLE_v10030742mg [Citrus x clementina]
MAIPCVLIHHVSSLLLLLALLFPGVAKAANINLESSLLATKDSNPWRSPSGEFAFGFHHIDNQDVFLLAIWFDKIPEKTIVWSANGDDPAPRGSQVKLTNSGELVLYDPQGHELWQKPKDGSKSSWATMQDDGNFVLLGGDSNPIWESFKEPTDTLLPGQILNSPINITSRRTQHNYSTGRFRFLLKENGNLELSSVSLTTQVVYDVYWSWNSEAWNADSQLIFDRAGYIYIKKGNQRIYNLTKIGTRSMQDFYIMARIDYDGVFRQYTHPKYETACNFTWRMEERIPQDICVAITGDIGSGACGYNSICAEINGEPKCLCPDNYSYLNQSDTSQGCKPNFPLPSCQDNGWETKYNELVDFKSYENTDWPLSDYDLQIGNGVNRQTCEQLCREDCFCAAAIYNGDYCWKKKYPLSNGRRSASVNRIALVKVPKVDVSKLLEKKDQSTLVLVICLLLGSSVFLNILLIFAISVAAYLFYHKKLLRSVSSPSATNVRSFTYKELEEATRGFRQILGRGAFGTVYKGVLASDSKRFVAIKKLDKVEQQGEKEFRTEVSVIGQTHHKNLVRLLGFCDEGDHRLLVYEYMSNGSLASFLFGITRPDWNQRVQIAFGIARGLMYLHEECSTQIIHCDIKPQNILLDDYFTPRISDFGLAKLLLAEQTQAARTGIRGTVGYFAPEWFRKASITVKVDVYSFGVLLLELICCKSSVVFGTTNPEEALMDWVYRCYIGKNLDKLAENDEEVKNDLKRVERLVMVALWCIQEDASLRPTMKKVTQMLEGVIEVSVPPCPWNYSSS